MKLTRSHGNRVSQTDPFPAAPEAVQVPIDALRLDGSPRLGGEDPGHARMLAEIGTGLPPIVVHRQTRRVIDGRHRVLAARLRGETEIRAVYFGGDERAAYVRAVAANVSHGLPLPLADRRVAAARIIAWFPEWSDRAVAAAAGLSPKTARAIRSRLAGGPDPAGAAARVGRDGKVRPLSTAESRRRAAVLLAEHPDASLREIASTAGVSPATVRDVRRRVRNGESPVPRGVRHAGPAPGTTAGPAGGGAEPVLAASLLQRLRQDPSLRYSERGRNLLRWLDAHVVEVTDWSRAVEGVPPHCMYTIAALARQCALAWEQLAADLAVRVAAGDPDAVS